MRADELWRRRPVGHEGYRADSRLGQCQTIPCDRPCCRAVDNSKEPSCGLYLLVIPTLLRRRPVEAGIRARAPDSQDLRANGQSVAVDCQRMRVRAARRRHASRAIEEHDRAAAVRISPGHTRERDVVRCTVAVAMTTRIQHAAECERGNEGCG